jgi:hypothetical protein
MSSLDTGQWSFKHEQFAIFDPWHATLKIYSILESELMHNPLHLRSLFYIYGIRSDIFRIENPSVWQIPMFSQIFT